MILFLTVMGHTKGMPATIFPLMWYLPAKKVSKQVHLLKEILQIYQQQKSHNSLPT